MTKTAVEYILNLVIGEDEQDKIVRVKDIISKSEIKQAKEMEKKIIAQAFEDGDYNYFYNHQNGREFETGIEYYNEKFKSE